LAFFWSVVAAGAIPLSLVFAAEAYMLVLFGLSRHIFIGLFLTANYSFVFIKLLTVFVACNSGQPSNSV